MGNASSSWLSRNRFLPDSHLPSYEILIRVLSQEDGYCTTDLGRKDSDLPDWVPAMDHGEMREVRIEECLHSNRTHKPSLLQIGLEWIRLDSKALTPLWSSKINWINLHVLWVIHDHVCKCSSWVLDSDLD